jgi:hypothetical protein
VANLKIEQIERFLSLDGAEPDHVVRDLAGALRIVLSGGARA